ncbi:MAG: hypothetical protein ACK5JF_08815 [Oscillospiraceae bacterium]
MKKTYTVLLAVLCLLLLVGCGGGQVRMGSEAESATSGAVQTSQVPDEYAGYDQTRLETIGFEPGEIYEGYYSFTDEERVEWQMVVPTLEAVRFSNQIGEFLDIGGAQVYLSDFKGIAQTSDMQLIEMGTYLTNKISLYIGKDGQSISYLEVYPNHVIAKLLSDIEAKEEYQSAKDIYYASDIEKNLEEMFGAYPIQDETYKDHFFTNEEEGVWYYPEVDILILRVPEGSYLGEDVPQITSIQNEGDTAVVEFVNGFLYRPYYKGLPYGYYTYGDNSDWVAVTSENFEEMTKNDEKYRYTFTKAADDGRWIIVSAEKIREYTTG